MQHYWDIYLTDVPFFVNENIGQKILSKDLENIVKKVASGKTLTSAERSLVEKAYGTSGGVKFAKTIVEFGWGRHFNTLLNG